MREDLFEAFIQGASEGETKLSINQGSAEDQVEVMRKDEDTDTEISGQVIDRNTKRGIPEILVIVIKPNVKVADFVRQKSKDMAYTSSRTNRSGRSAFPKQIPNGQALDWLCCLRVQGYGYLGRAAHQPSSSGESPDLSDPHDGSIKDSKTKPALTI